AWMQWGVNALCRLNGMFAFAVVNQHTGEMWLVRDRYGVKPLVWGQLPAGGLVFSSSVAAVAHCIGAPVNTGYCAHGLRYRAFESREGETPFVGIRSVLPGCWLKVRVADGLVLENGCWYDLAFEVEKQAF